MAEVLGVNHNVADIKLAVNTKKQTNRFIKVSFLG